MKKFLPITLLFVLISYFSFSQGIVRGKITDKSGETLIGATVVLKSNPSVGSVTDFDGNYSIKIADATPQTLVITFISYKTLEEVVNPHDGEVIIKNIILQSSANEVKTVEVTAKAIKSRNYYMEKVKLNSATTLDYVSSETMKKTGDANVTSAVARVAGVSTNGQFITVRGIGDRYVKTAINGSRIPTLDPFTNNIKLDLFPASLVDNVIITKTASPDLPGDWAGAYLSIETKDYPEELAVNVETQFGYNTQSTNKEIISSQRSSTDWLGYDKDLRSHDHTSFNEALTKPTQYQQLVALGLGNYYSSMGVTGWTDNSDAGTTYFKLGLVQLGLLAPAMINDEQAFKTAKDQYMNGSYQSDAFYIINGKVPDTGKSFANNWNPTKRKAPINFSQTISIGNQTKLFGNPLGFIAGLRYGSVSLYDPNVRAARASAVDDGNNNGNYMLTSKTEDRELSREINSWSALVNLSYKLNSNNSVSLLYMPNFIGNNNVYSGVDRDYTDRYVTKSQYYEQRKQLVYQLKTEHFIPAQKIKIELNASYTNGKSSVPDFKNLQYKQDSVPGGYTYLIGNGVKEGIHRYYRYLSDNLFDSRLAIELPLDNKPELTRKLKFGGAYQKNNRKSDQYDYEVMSSSTNLPNGDIEQFFNLDNYNIQTYTNANGAHESAFNLYYADNTIPADHTFGNSSVIGGFVMTDYSLSSMIRFSGGLRVEKAEIFTDVFKFDSLGLEPNDPRRQTVEGTPLVNPGELNEISYLPSINLIYKLNADELAPVNLRFNYSRSAARPSIRELSDVSTFDYELRGPVFGNSELKMVGINNYDVRIESYFKSGDQISASVFYKKFRNHIELVRSNGYTWQNVDKSFVAGVELEGRKKLTKNFEIGANVSLAQSESKFIRYRLEISNGAKNYIPQDTIKRTMFGQAPYVINAMVTYTADSLGLSATVSYNLQGSRLVIASDNPYVPDVYEQPRNLIDLKITKKLGKHFSVAFTIRDLFNAPVQRTYRHTDYDYIYHRNGTNYQLGFSYKI